MRLYCYVGPKAIADRAKPEALLGATIRTPDDVRAWARTTGQHLLSGCVIATFIVDEDGVLRIADRRSEHVACAGGRPVRSAGEMTFALGHSVDVVEVSNQSTGYCPEPESWTAVAAVLKSAGLSAPSGFSLDCHFRRCLCGNVTLIKDGIFKCGICGKPLPAGYNVQDE
jgi:hypothetical protein